MAFETVTLHYEIVEGDSLQSAKNCARTLAEYIVARSKFNLTIKDVATQSTYASYALIDDQTTNSYGLFVYAQSDRIAIGYGMGPTSGYNYRALIGYLGGNNFITFDVEFTNTSIEFKTPYGMSRMISNKYITVFRCVNDVTKIGIVGYTNFITTGVTLNPTPPSGKMLIGASVGSNGIADTSGNALSYRSSVSLGVGETVNINGQLYVCGATNTLVKVEV